jgi:hypothetical protein
MFSAMRLSRPVSVIAAARNSAAATSTKPELEKPLKAKPSAALVPSNTFGLATLGANPSRNAINAAITIADTA